MMKALRTLKAGFVVLLLLLLAGCKTTAPVIPSGLGIEGREVIWAAVEGATGYVLKIDETEIPTLTNAYTLPSDLFGKIRLSVQAVFPSGSSDFSEIILVNAVLQLSAPASITQTGPVISWDAVANATGYVIKIDGVEHLTTLPSYTFTTLTEPLTVQILAVGNVAGTLLSSAYSSPYQVSLVLAEPANIQVSDGIVTWDAVTEAAGYEILIDEADEWTTVQTSIDLKYEYAGNISFQIRAVSETEGYLDSPYATVALTFPTLTLSTPVNLAIENGTLSFGAVQGATGYEIYNQGSLVATIGTNSYAIPSLLLLDSNTVLSVIAVSDVHHDSAASIGIYVATTLITTEAELRALQATGNYSLGNDIVLTAPWIPKDFAGLFDGNGFAISGLSITADALYVGFFGLLDSARITDLTLEGEIDVTVLLYAGTGIGGLAGKITGSTVENCTIHMTITAVSASGIGFLGGVAGLLENTDLTNLVFTGNITAENMVAGGLVGKAQNPERSSEIRTSSYEGHLVVTGGEQSIAGGFIGQLVNNSLRITECFAKGEVTGTSYVGGFVGYLGSGHIDNCYVSGTVTGTAAQILHLGGFAGRVEGYNNSLEKCLAMTTIWWYAENDGIHAGGFAGHTPQGGYATLYSDCYYDNTLAPLDRIGNPDDGRGDGITGRSTLELLTIPGFDPDIWDFTGSAPRFGREG